jgi:hypothetical protein
VWLLRGSVLRRGGYRGRVDVTNVVLVQHRTSGRAVADILKVVGCILGCKKQLVSM